MGKKVPERIWVCMNHVTDIVKEGYNSGWVYVSVDKSEYMGPKKAWIEFRRFVKPKKSVTPRKRKGKAKK